MRWRSRANAGRTLLGNAEKLDEEPNLAKGLDRVGGIRLHYSRQLGAKRVLLRVRSKDAVAERALEDTDAPPYAWLRGMAASERGGNRGLRELSGALVGNHVRRK